VLEDDRTPDPIPALFTPLTLRGVTLPSRMGVSPMCMNASTEGHATDFHLVHLGRFALGGAGLVIAEATAIEPRGRISHGDLGIWDDAHLPGLRRIASFLAEHGAIPGIQLAHAGRRASVREPWLAGAPLDESDAAAGRPPWPVVGPSALPAGPGWPTPTALDAAGITAVIASWRRAARRALDAGFRFIELHGAHGYLLHSFLSPVSNHRDDRYGGSPDGRMRYPLEVVAAVRDEIGPDVPLAYRISAVDGVAEGLGLDDAVLFATRLADAGVDLVDVSSGGITTDRSMDGRIRRSFSFHADFSRRIRSEAGIPVATVGLIVDPHQALGLVEQGDADLILLGREMLHDPSWPSHARLALGDASFADSDIRFGSALAPRAARIAALLEQGETPTQRREG